MTFCEYPRIWVQFPLFHKRQEIKKTKDGGTELPLLLLAVLTLLPLLWCCWRGPVIMMVMPEEMAGPLWQRAERSAGPWSLCISSSNISCPGAWSPWLWATRSLERSLSISPLLMMLEKPLTRSNVSSLLIFSWKAVWTKNILRVT